MSSIKSLLATVLLASAASLTFAQSPAPVTDGATTATPAMTKIHKATANKKVAKHKPAKKHLKVSKAKKNATTPQA
jgi:hypothetical protein